MAFDLETLEKLAVTYGPTVIDVLVDGFRYLRSLAEPDAEKVLQAMLAKKEEVRQEISGLDEEVARADANVARLKAMEALDTLHQAEVSALLAKQAAERKSLAARPVATDENHP